MDCHIGSQLTELSPYIDALDRLLALIDGLRNQRNQDISHLDLGGGLGIRYRDEEPPLPAEWASGAEPKAATASTVPCMIEPGRAIAGNAGILVSRVNYLKHGAGQEFCRYRRGDERFDSAQSLYDAWQEIIRVELQSDADRTNCTTSSARSAKPSDFLGKERKPAVSPRMTCSRFARRAPTVSRMASEL